MPVSPTKYDRPHVGCLARAEVTNTRRRPGIINKYTANIAHLSDFKSYDLHAFEHKIRLVNMSGRLVTARLATLARRTALHTPRLYTTHSLPAGGLLRNEAGLRLIKRRPWPLGSYALHNLPATRSISFARVVPKLVTKLATAGAAAGGAVIAGVSYIQYQAGRTHSSTPCPRQG